MILSCPNCATKYTLNESQLGVRGRTVRCAACKTTWHAERPEKPIDLSFSDWTLGGGGDTLHYGNLIVATTPYRNESGGGKDNVTTHMFATAPVTLTQTPVSITLPKNRDLRVFTVAAG